MHVQRQIEETLAVAAHLESIGIDIVRGGFASWVREGLGFTGTDEHLDRALTRVARDVSDGRAVSAHDLALHIAQEMPVAAPPGRIDAFGGSAWCMD